jgi:hypothetical protein
MIKNGLIVILILLSIYLFTGKKQIKTVSTRIDTVLTTKTITKFIKGDKIRYRILDTINTNSMIRPILSKITTKLKSLRIALGRIVTYLLSMTPLVKTELSVGPSKPKSKKKR